MPNLQFIFKSLAVISVGLLVMGFIVAGEGTKLQNNVSFSGVSPYVGQPKALFSGVIPAVGTNLGKGLFSGEIPAVVNSNKAKATPIPLNLTKPNVATKQLNETPAKNVTNPVKTAIPSQNVTIVLNATAPQNVTNPMNTIPSENITNPLNATVLQNVTNPMNTIPSQNVTTALNATAPQNVTSI